MEERSKQEVAGRREVKRAVRAALEAEDFEAALEDLLALPLRPLCSPLIGAAASADERVKWRAVRALGAVVANLADASLPAAREILRRLNWSLTEEAGSIGWGAPEAMAEILARHEDLAREYAPILVSYAGEDHLLDHPALLRGALWGIGRLAQARPALLREAGAVEVLKPYLEAEDDAARELARAALSCLQTDDA